MAMTGILEGKVLAARAWVNDVHRDGKVISPHTGVDRLAAADKMLVELLEATREAGL